MRTFRLLALTGFLSVGILGCDPEKYNQDELDNIQSSECCGEVGQLPSEPEEDDDND